VIFTNRYLIPEEKDMIWLKEDESGRPTDNGNSLIRMLREIALGRIRYFNAQLETIQKAAEDPEDPSHDRAVAALADGREALLERLDDIYTNSKDYEEIMEKTKELGFMEYGIVSLDMERKALRDKKRLREINQKTLFRLTGKNSVDELSDEEITQLVEKLVGTHWAIIATRSSGAILPHAEFIARQKAESSGEQIILVHAHPIVADLYPTLKEKILNENAAFDREKLLKIIGEVDIKQVASETKDYWTGKLSVSESRFNRLQALIEKLNSPDYDVNDVEGFDEFLSEEYININYDAYTGQKFDSDKDIILYRLKLLNSIYSNLETEVKVNKLYTEEVEKDLEEIAKSDDLEDRVRILTTIRDIPRFGTFGESETDSDAAISYKLAREDGQEIDEVLSIIENAMGTVYIRSYLNRPETELTMAGIKKEKPVVFKEYRIGQMIEGRYLIAAEGSMKNVAKGARVSDRYDRLPRALIQDTVTRDYYSMLPLDMLSDDFKEFILNWVRTVQDNVPEIDLEIKEIDGQVVLLTRIMDLKVRILSRKEIADLKTRFRNAGMDDKSIEETITAFENNYKIGSMIKKGILGGTLGDVWPIMQAEQIINGLINDENYVREGEDELAELIRQKLWLEIDRDAVVRYDIALSRLLQTPIEDSDVRLSLTKKLLSFKAEVAKKIADDFGVVVWELSREKAEDIDYNELIKNAKDKAIDEAIREGIIATAEEAEIKEEKEAIDEAEVEEVKPDLSFARETGERGFIRTRSAIAMATVFAVLGTFLLLFTSGRSEETIPVYSREVPTIEETEAVEQLPSEFIETIKQEAEVEPEVKETEPEVEPEEVELPEEEIPGYKYSLWEQETIQKFKDSYKKGDFDKNFKEQLIELYFEKYGRDDLFGPTQIILAFKDIVPFIVEKELDGLNEKNLVEQVETINQLGNMLWHHNDIGSDVGLISLEKALNGIRSGKEIPREMKERLRKEVQARLYLWLDLWKTGLLGSDIQYKEIFGEMPRVVGQGMLRNSLSSMWEDMGILSKEEYDSANEFMRPVLDKLREEEEKKRREKGWW